MLKALLRYLEEAAERYVEWAGPAPNLPHRPLPKPPDASYRIYTAEFDETIDAAAFVAHSNGVIEAQESSLQSRAIPNSVARAPFVATLRANCASMTERLQRSLTREQRDDTVVSLLFDHSGSLRGTTYLAVAEVAEALADALTDADIATDVLSFTTVRWKGGLSRAKWLKDGRPKMPGRLNDLLHVVHLDASGGPRKGPHKFPVMRLAHILKENIDGEALDWAHARLQTNPRRRRILVMVSDGAPVDEATLTYNWSTILVDHLLEVIAQIQASDTVLGGLGIQHELKNYFANSIAAKPIDELANVAPQFVEQMIKRAHDESDLSNPR